MTNDSERALRLYVEEIVSPPSIVDVPGWASLCSALTEVTGWSLSSTRAVDGNPVDIQVVPGVDRPRMTREVVAPLTGSIRDLLHELERTRTALWHREAELAAGVPVRARRDEEPHLAVRLEAILRSGAEAVVCRAAAAYLLDESTSELKLRACWGLPRRKLLEPARPLRGSIADLEALLGHAVVLDSPTMLQQWKAPEKDFASAVCVPIASPTMPLGTLWVFGDDAREYSPQQTAVLEIVAGRLAAEFEREILLADAERHRATRPNSIGSAEAWRRSRQPTIEPLIDGWELAGWSAPWNECGGGFFDWNVLPDGNLSLAVGQGHGKGDLSRLNGAALHGMLKVLAPTHPPRTLVRTISDSFWSSSSGDQWASMSCLLAEPESGSLLAGNAGNAAVFAVDHGRARSLLKVQPALGTDPDCHYSQCKSKIEPGQTLVLCAASGLDDRDQRASLERRLAAISDSAGSAEQWVRLLRNDTAFSGPNASRSAVLVVRRGIRPA